MSNHTEFYNMVKKYRNAQKQYFKTSLIVDRKNLAEVGKEIDTLLFKNKNSMDIKYQEFRLLEIEKMDDYSLLFINLGYNVSTSKRGEEIFYSVFSGTRLSARGGHNDIDLLFEKLGYRIKIKN